MKYIAQYEIVFSNKKLSRWKINILAREFIERHKIAVGILNPMYEKWNKEFNDLYPGKDGYSYEYLNFINSKQKDAIDIANAKSIRMNRVKLCLDDMGDIFVKTKKVISNPPYSLSWNPTLKQFDKRFQGYPLAPKSKADYAFILHGLSQIEDNGTLLAILPHGVLFRGSAEGKIREQLIKENLIDAVIGLPDKLFLNTGIPVLILVLKKNRKTNDVLFIDASKEFVIGSKKQNEMSVENINKVVEAYKNRQFVDKFAYISRIEEIIENNYNLNIPRYVDTYEPPEVPDLLETLNELQDIEREIKETSISLLN